MSKIPSVSVVVAVYNAEKYLNNCVDSILNQTFTDLELILVDDGSVDSSADICDQYAKKDDRVTLLRKDNGGPTSARQTGLKIATGEYILFFDSDDWLEKNAIDVIFKSAIENNADIVTFNGYFNYSHHQSQVRQSVKSGVFDKKGLIENVYPTMIYSGRFFYFGVFAAMWNKLFRKSLIEPILLNIDPRIKMFEDGLTTFPAFLDAQRVCVLGDEYLYHYRDYNSSITRSYFENQFDNALMLLDSMRSMSAKRKNIYDVSKQIDHFFIYNVRNAIVEEFYYRYKKSFVKRFADVREIVNHSETRKMCQRVSSDGMSTTVKLFFWALKNRLTSIVILVSLAKAYNMRLKVAVRRVLKRY